MSFINFNNKTETQSKTYTKTMVLSALLTSETKNTSKARTMVSGLNDEVTLNEALALFSNKLNAMTALNIAAIEYKPLLEGQFSWMTHDRGEQIGSERENTINVWMFDNEGNMWYEKNYEGYGVFGGMDYYELMAKMNGYSEEDLDIKVGKRNKIYREIRGIGIALAFGDLETRDKEGDVLFPALMSDPKGFNYKRHDFTEEAQHDPNQSWYQEPEYDEDEDEDYYESKTNEAVFGAKDFNKTLISYAIDTRADEIYIIKVDTVIKSGFPDVSKVPDKRFHGMFGMMLEDNWMKQYDKLPEVGDILPAPKKDKAFESKVSEGAISDIHIMAQEAKDFKSFVKAFTKEHHDLSGAGEPGQFEAWLQTIYDDAKESMDESITEGFEVHYSDGVRAFKKFSDKNKAIAFAKDLIKNKSGLQFVDVFNAGSGFHSTADTDAIIAFWGDGSYTDNISKSDTKLAAKKINESITEGMISPKMANGFKIGNKIKTQKDTYTITGFGQRTGATRDFEAENEKGEKFNLRVSLRGATGIQVAAGKSLNFPEQEEMLESAVTEAKKQKFVLYTNPGNSTNAGYIAIGAADVREILSDAKNYSDSCKILYQGSGTQADLLKAKQMFSDYRFGNESIDESTTNEVKSSTYFATAGLSKDETKKVAETLAKAMSKAEGSKVTVNLKTLEEDSFDLDVDGEEFDGGSYNIYDNGSVVNHAVTPNEIYGNIDSSVDDFIKGLKKPLKESVVNEAKKPKTWDTTFAMNAIADYEAGKFDPDNDKSLADWEKEYNGGKKPNPEFETYDIIMWALATGKKPDGTPIKESKVNEMIGTFALGVMLAWAGIKVLKVVAKKVVGTIGMNVEVSADELKNITQEMVDKVAEETGSASAILDTTNLKMDIDKKIDSGEIKNIAGINKELERYLKANESYSIEVNEAVADLRKYVEDASNKTFKKGGNGQNLLDNAMELAYHIGENQVGRDTRGYEEDGWYEPATVALFKKLVDSMSADDIKNNSEDQYESVVTEGRSINKIQKEWSEVTTKMKSGVEDWKKAPEGELKTSLFANLKSLTARKKELEAELDDAVQLKDVDAELAGESFVYEAEIKSDDEFKDYAFDVLKKAFGTDFDEAKATKTVDGILSKAKNDYGKAIGMLTAGLGESVATKPSKAERWIKLLEKLNKSINEDLRADLKKYIKSNEKELNAFADDDNWEAIHNMLRSDFEVKEGSKEEDNLFTTFNFVF